MSSTKARPIIHVEGKDDLFSLVEILIKNGFEDYRNEVKLQNQTTPFFKNEEGVEFVLEAIKNSVENSKGLSRAFILDTDQSLIPDADQNISNRWHSVRDRLNEVDVQDVPEDCPPNGFIGYSEKFKTRVGVWVMPDNQSNGMLEDFLMTLIPENDPLFVFAKESTDQAKTIKRGDSIENNFSDFHQQKAELHSFLAWQNPPGKPFGIAIKSNVLKSRSDLTDRFIDWFCKLFELEKPIIAEN